MASPNSALPVLFAIAPAGENTRCGCAILCIKGLIVPSSLKRQLLILGLIVVTTLLVLYLASVFIEVTLAVIVAAMLYYLSEPMVLVLERWRVPRVAAILIVFIVFLALIALLLIYTIPIIVTQLTSLAADVPGAFERFQQWLARMETRLGAQIGEEQLDEAINRAGATVSGLIETAVAGIFGVLANVFSLLLVVVAGAVAAFFLLKDHREMEGYAERYVPEDSKPLVHRLASGIHNVLSGFLRGRVIVALIIGVVVWIGLVIIGVPYAFILGVISAILEFIPYLGPILAAIPAVLIALTVSPLSALITLSLFFVIQQLESFVLSPRVVGAHVKLHPATVIFAVLIGGRILGLLGVFVAIPVAGMAKVFVEEFLLPPRSGDEDRGGSDVEE